MTLAAPPIALEPAPKPTFEGDFALPGEFPLEAGGVLRSAQIHYAVYGNINALPDNVVLVCHALSGSAQVAEWWPAIFSAEGLVDSEKDAVLGINILGSCYGSTGPTSIDPDTDEPYGATFPLVCIRDVIRAQALLLDSLGISRIKLAIGASIGGMQVLQWAIQFPARVARAIVIAACPLGAMGLALNHLQRQAIMLDPDWKEGEYSAEQPPGRGLALARALGVISYKSDELFAERYGRNPDRSGEDPWKDEGLPGGRFDVSGYMDHQGEKFNSRFDANCYLVITRMMDLFDPIRPYSSPAEAWSRIQARLTMVGISSDWLFPAVEIEALARVIKAVGVQCEYRELTSNHGHDSFLAEPRHLLDILTS
jgi:homoserine O-acetyltransferase/O-succinyltransferase